MLFLAFQLGRDRYLLDVAEVIEVLPLVQWKTIPHAPPGIAGVFNFRDTPVPLVDLSALALGRPAAARLSTRIVLVRYPLATGESRLLGLVAENATETIRRDPGDFTSAGVATDAAPYLGPVARDAHGLLQWVAPARLLSPAVRDVLFRETAPAS